MKLTEKQFNYLLKVLTDIGISLSAEKDHARLLELILKKALEITNSDGGTLYSCIDNSELKFEIMINKSMKIHLGGTSGKPVIYQNLPLYDEDGSPNNHMLAPWAAISRETINIKDAYRVRKFDLSGTKKFDKATGYHSQSFLTVPMTNHLNEVIGVLQLINPLDKKTKKIIPFSKLDQHLVESLASQAAVTVTNRELIEAQKNLFDSLIQLIANAIDEKSPYTGGHCRRVPVITLMLAKAACEANSGPLKDFKMTDDEMYELEVAAWLHDCGKITTPEAVVDKATKLEGIYDGIQLVETRFEVLKRDLMIEYLQEKLKALTGEKIALEKDEKLQHQLQTLNEELNLIRACNFGGEYMHDDQLQRIRNIAQHQWCTPAGEMENILTSREVSMLGIHRGTLSNQERDIINNHVTMTLKMLKALPYPKNLRNVPELAGSHHEKLDGSGYPRHLTKHQMSIPARMIAIADIFEALTAQDRPYKKSIPLPQALSIMQQMKAEGHIDPDLYDVFISANIPEQYAKDYLPHL
jgi:HD-GYP domain-containing protein (c-di-GMP phosphodiesterase class II)